MEKTKCILKGTSVKIASNNTSVEFCFDNEQLTISLQKEGSQSKYVHIDNDHVFRKMNNLL